MFQSFFSDAGQHSRTGPLANAASVTQADLRKELQKHEDQNANLQKASSSIPSFNTQKFRNVTTSIPISKSTDSLDSTDSPVFNDHATSDIRIDIFGVKGDLYTSLYLHSNILREQSDFFFSALKSRSAAPTPSPAHPSPEVAPLNFSVHVSRHVNEPDAYVSTFKMFYLEEEDMPEEIQCLGSVWRVLETLIVASELQFHMCSAACVDYLESVPWNDNEMADILKLLNSVDHLAEAKQVLDRLPVRQWDEDTLSESLRVLLMKAVAYSDEDPPVMDLKLGQQRSSNNPMNHINNGSSSSNNNNATTAATGSNGTKAEHSEGSDSAAVKEDAAASSVDDGNAAKDGSKKPEPAGKRAARRKGQLPPGTMECREAACAILRNRHEPMLSLRVKKGVLKDTFVDLLQGLWSEGKGKGGGGGGRGAGTAAEGGASANGSVEGAGGKADKDGKDEEEREDALVYGPQGALTWLVGVMLEFSMADEVFKWLATDDDFVAQVRGGERKREHCGREGGRASKVCHKPCRAAVNGMHYHFV